MPKPPKASYSYDVAKSCGGLRTFMQRNPILMKDYGLSKASVYRYLTPAPDTVAGELE
jgi:hypothetical protein